MQSNNFFDSHLTTTEIDNNSTTIVEQSAGSVRMFGAQRYYDGESTDEYCISFMAYITEEDRVYSAAEK